MKIWILALLTLVCYHLPTTEVLGYPIVAFIRVHQLWIKKGDQEIQVTKNRYSNHVYSTLCHSFKNSKTYTNLLQGEEWTWRKNSSCWFLSDCSVRRIGNAKVMGQGGCMNRSINCLKILIQLRCFLQRNNRRTLRGEGKKIILGKSKSLTFEDQHWFA